jgi:hypothetical protein
MNWQTQQLFRRKVFISYHRADSDEVNRFLEGFSRAFGAFLARGIGAGMPGDIINSTNTDYVMTRIRQLYLGDSTVTLVMIGKCTWSRKFVDWELQSSLRSGLTVRPNGLLGVKLQSFSSGQYPDRLNTNLLSPAESRMAAKDCYARVIEWPTSPENLRLSIEDAFEARTKRAILIKNPRDRFKIDRHCGHPWH